MKKYQVTLVKNDPYCRLATGRDPDCLYSMTVEANSKFAAANKCIPKPTPPFDISTERKVPIVWEVVEKS